MRNRGIILGAILLPALFSISQQLNIHTSSGTDTYSLEEVESIDLDVDLSLPGTVRDIDGNVYLTVIIGNQEWMAENLSVTHYNNGDAIPNVTDNTEWEHLKSGAYCDYENDVNNSEIYGRLYNWYAITDSRDLAPDGWHVPTDEEWKEMEMFLGMSQAEADNEELRGVDEGGKLKDTGTEYWYHPNTGANNESGFEALPAGEQREAFRNLHQWACIWTSTPTELGTAWYRSVHYNDSMIARRTSTKAVGFSIRCVKD